MDEHHGQFAGRDAAYSPPEQRVVASGEGWAWYAAELDGRWFLTKDAGTMRELAEAMGPLDPSDEHLFEPRVLEFESEEALNRYVEEHTSPRSRER